MPPKAFRQPARCASLVLFTSPASSNSTATASTVPEIVVHGGVEAAGVVVGIFGQFERGGWGFFKVVYRRVSAPLASSRCASE